MHLRVLAADAITSASLCFDKFLAKAMEHLSQDSDETLQCVGVCWWCVMGLHVQCVCVCLSSFFFFWER